MRVLRRAWSIAVVPSLLLGLVACQGTVELEGPDPDDPGDPTALTLPANVVSMGQIVYGESPTGVRFLPGEKQGYLLVGKKGNTFSLSENMNAGGLSVTSTVAVFGPAAADGTFPGTALNGGSGSGVFFSTTLPATGTYLVTVTSNVAGGDPTYNLSINCSAVGCKPNTASPMSFGRTRITQAAIDRKRFTPAQLFAFGDFLFEHVFTVDEGWGNALGAPAPNLRRLHKGKFGGPDSNSCDRCHVIGGRDGAGTNLVNMLQDGDGVNANTALVRNARQVIGVGYLEILGEEMTAELAEQVAAGKSLAAATGQAQTVALSAKGVRFGQVVVAIDGTVDTTGVEGIDTDLVVKPLGWKGRVASLRRFVEGGFQVHLGMQSESLVAAHCQSPIPDVVGTGADCHDPDGDGVVDELTEGQLSAVTIYVAMQQAPVRIDPTAPKDRERIRGGELLFAQIGCATCHVPTLTIEDPTHRQTPDSTGMAPFAIDLPQFGRAPALAYDGDGLVPVDLYSDLKRHDMGSTLADPHPTFGTIPAKMFMTAPLWGLAASEPFLHDGRSGTGSSTRGQIYSAINQHGGEAQAARDAFMALPGSGSAPNDQQWWIVDFLMTLTRDPAHVDD